MTTGGGSEGPAPDAGSPETKPLLRRRNSPNDIPLLRVMSGRDMLAHAVISAGESLEVGRDATCNLVLTDASVSRRHARLQGDGRVFDVVDLGSRNGTFVNGRQVQQAAVALGDRLEVGSVPMRVELASIEELEHLRRVIARLHALDRDPLTGLLTRAWIDEQLPALMESVAAGGKQLAAVFVDLDHFKSINDTFGHAVGDDVLRQVGRLVSLTVREREASVRYGGEEIVLFLQDATVESAAAAADRLRHVIASHDWGTFGENLLVTVSCGVAQWTPGESVRDWLDRADRALYVAKSQGRNRVRKLYS